MILDGIWMEKRLLKILAKRNIIIRLYLEEILGLKKHLKIMVYILNFWMCMGMDESSMEVKE